MNYGQYTSKEIIRAAGLSCNPLTMEIVYRWKWYMKAMDYSLDFIAGRLSLDEFEQKTKEMADMINHGKGER